ncbi:hypothetical protein BR93DRAFT_984516 [Coniochaeta sp. PMI_546]|nr:hypothetical protein BR93DRAFT_984516 [Coniochaeta sp. PMI_546]
MADPEKTLLFKFYPPVPKPSPPGPTGKSINLRCEGVGLIPFNLGRSKLYTVIPASILSKQDYFVSLFSGRYINYFLIHGVFPLCFDPVTGHYDRLYEEILADAIYHRENRYDKGCTVTIPMVISRPGGMVETDMMQVQVWRKTNKKIRIREGWCSVSG